MKLLKFILIVVFFCTMPVFSQLNVSMTSPAEGEVFSACAAINLAANVDIVSGDVKEVRFYANSLHKKRDSKAPFEYEWENVTPGFYAIYAQAKDDDGNIFLSDTVNVQVGEIIEYNQVKNGGFDCSLSPWSKAEYVNGKYTANIMDDGWFDDDSYLEVTVQSVGDQPWSCQLIQSVDVDSGHTYELTFLADAAIPKEMEFLFQGPDDPYPVFLGQKFPVEEFGVYGPYIFECEQSVENLQFKFIFSNDSESIMMDDIRLIDLTSQETKVDMNFESVESFQLFQNYPNPFNPSTTIMYQLNSNSEIDLGVFNVKGELVKTIDSGFKNSGQYSVSWNGTNASGQNVPSGVYFYKLISNENGFQQTSTGKMMLLK